MRCRPIVFAFVSAPVDTLALLHIPALPLVCSLGWNSIGAEGASALAAILKETQITTLRCAAPECSHFCQRPLTRKRTLWGCPPLSLSPASPSAIAPLDRSLEGNNIRVDVLKETMISNLKCAAQHPFRVSAH